MKSPVFNGLLMVVAVWAAYLPIRELPDRRLLPAASHPLRFERIELGPATGQLRLAGAWIIGTDDHRFGGLSALAIDGDQFLAVTDRGAALRFGRPSQSNPAILIADLGEGPGPYGKKWTRDAESLARDPGGRGWWIGYEQNHSLWLYDSSFSRVLESIPLDRPDWWDNRGAEGLVAKGQQLLVAGENGRDAMRVGSDGIAPVPMAAGADVAEAALAPDGSIWLLLRARGLEGISQSVAPLVRDRGGYRAGSAMSVPKGAFDNFEGMTIEALPDGRWRFWLVTDDGHRIMARTLLVAFDYRPAGHDKSPAPRTGLSEKPAVERP